MSTENDTLLVRVDDGVGHVTFNQPAKRNAISYDMWVGIAEAMARFTDDDAVRLVVLSGAGGRAFSAGADISEFEEKRGTEDAVAKYNAATARAHAALAAFPKPTIAAIEGFCVGGGAAVAVTCDLRIAADDAAFAIPAARLGLGYHFDNLRPLVELVGATSAKEILFTARRFSAEEALQMGLVNRVVPKSVLGTYVTDYAKRIAHNAPLTVQACKGIIGQVMAEPGERDLALCQQLVDRCFASEDYKEGRRAFMEKRLPRFQGR
jgi:enoyl-CoA hydratase/carnithine racemase